MYDDHLFSWKGFAILSGLFLSFFAMLYRWYNKFFGGLYYNKLQSGKSWIIDLCGTGFLFWMCDDDSDGEEWFNADIMPSNFSEITDAW